MRERRNLTRLTMIGALVALTGYATAQEPMRFAGAPCDAAPVLHCPDKDCPGDRVINPGPVV